MNLVSYKFAVLASLVSLGRVDAARPRLYAAEGLDAHGITDLAETADNAVRDMHRNLMRVEREVESTRSDIARGYIRSSSIASYAADLAESQIKAKLAIELLERMFDAMVGLTLSVGIRVCSAHVDTSSEERMDSLVYNVDAITAASGAVILARAMAKDDADRRVAAAEAAKAAREAEEAARKEAKAAARRASRKAVAS